jgi:hypothetical protein
MRKIFIIIISLVLLTTGTALAECPEGKTEITIVNPARKVIEICVPDEAIPGIENENDNSGSTIIPAICPCFTQEEIEVAFSTDPTFTCYPIEEGTTLGSEPCYSIECFNSDDTIYYETTTSTGTYDASCNSKSWIAFNSTQCFGNIYGGEDTSKEEADACFEILKTFLR